MTNRGRQEDIGSLEKSLLFFAAEQGRDQILSPLAVLRKKIEFVENDANPLNGGMRRFIGHTYGKTCRIGEPLIYLAIYALFHTSYP